jgi:hypothetical protein
MSTILPLRLSKPREATRLTAVVVQETNVVRQSAAAPVNLDKETQVPNYKDVRGHVVYWSRLGLRRVSGCVGQRQRRSPSDRSTLDNGS